VGVHGIAGRFSSPWDGALDGNSGWDDLFLLSAAKYQVAAVHMLCYTCGQITTQVAMLLAPRCDPGPLGATATILLVDHLGVYLPNSSHDVMIHACILKIRFATIQ
jgi:hypothetical protein